MDLPSQIPLLGFLFAALLLSCSLVLGPISLLFSGNIIGFSQYGMSYGWTLGIFVSLILIVFLNRSNRIFEGNHRVIISESGVSVSGKLLGLIRLPAETFALSDFKDIDATQAWGLTLLFGDRRVRCDLPATEGQCLIGEMIDALVKLVQFHSHLFPKKNRCGGWDLNPRNVTYWNLTPAPLTRLGYLRTPPNHYFLMNEPLC